MTLELDMEIKLSVQALCLYVPFGWVDTGIPGSGMENRQQGCWMNPRGLPTPCV